MRYLRATSIPNDIVVDLALLRFIDDLYELLFSIHFQHNFLLPCLIPLENRVLGQLIFLTHCNKLFVCTEGGVTHLSCHLAQPHFEIHSHQEYHFVLFLLLFPFIVGVAGGGFESTGVNQLHCWVVELRWRNSLSIFNGFNNELNGLVLGTGELDSLPHYSLFEAH